MVKPDAKLCGVYGQNSRKNFSPSLVGASRAQAKKPEESDVNSCITSHEARYRGEENQLYRVEIHQGGKVGEASFKWSRDNSSVIFPILSISGNEIVLEHLGRDEKLGLKVGDWVELIDDDYTLLVQSRPSPLPDFSPKPLAQVDEVDLVLMRVTLKLKKDYDLPHYDETEIKDLHPLLRRWDYREADPTKNGEPKFKDGGFSGLLVEEASCEDDDGWLILEDGVQMCFQAQNADYQAGDYWLIPARTITGDVEWPGALPPHGVNHHYAPLAILRGWGESERDDLRCVIETASDSLSVPPANKKSLPAKV